MMNLTREEIQLALRISRTLEKYFKSAGKTNLRSTDLFEVLARNGLFPRDPKNNGIEFRRFLKKLKRQDMLHLIPQCDGIDQDEFFTNWYFHSAADEMNNRVKLPVNNDDIEFIIEDRQAYKEESIEQDSLEAYAKHEEVSILLKDLNDRQVEAVFSEEKRILVLAGAGSGKTKTLIHKILYLLFVKNVPPSKILAITFTKNAANEMLDRLLSIADIKGEYKTFIEDSSRSNKEKDLKRREYLQKYKWISGLTIKTFHAYCYLMLKERGSAVFDNKFKLLLGKNPWYSNDDNQMGSREMANQILLRVIRELCSDSKFLLRVKQYILDYYVNNEGNIKRKGNYDQDLKYVTLRGDKVRSKSERLIADWLYRHDINYEYEKTVNWASFNFQPDFYIPEIDLYLEHLSSQSYSMKDKERQFQKAGKVLVKTYEEQVKDIGEFYHILGQIFSSRISREYKHIENLKFEEEFNSIEDKLNFFIEEGLLRAIDMIKVQGIDHEKVIQRGLKNQHKRIHEFYEILGKVYKPFHDYCTEYSYIDFNDLILLSLKLLRDFPEVKEMYQDDLDYLLIDEFQDVNNLQVDLIKELISEQTQLFCVGDDWQSIYGFRGSEVDYIINFSDHFNNPNIIKLDINYRSSETIVKASNELIAHNKNIVNKEIRAFSGKGNKIHLYSAQSESDDGAQMVHQKILQLAQAGYKQEDILILYRRNKKYYEDYKPLLKSDFRHFTNKTIHSAKGLESKVVFIVGLTGGTYGFPFMMESDLIFQVIKKVQVDLLKEEERRLFYVALTRAKQQLFLVTEQGNESEFIKEIKEEYFDRENFLSLSFSDNKLTCKQCNAELKNDFSFCPYCGCNTKLDNTSYQQEEFEIKKAAESSVKYEKTHSKKYSTLEKQQVLKCLNDIDYPTGRTYLSRVLKGSKTVLNNRPEMEEFEFFSIYSGYTQKQILDYIDELLDKGFIESNGKAYMPTIRLTGLGIKYLEENKSY